MEVSVVKGGPRVMNPAVTELEPKRIRYRKRKRILDIAAAVLALVVLAPLFLIVAIAVKVTSKGPVIYKQSRVGLCGKIFTFYKFRSMYVDAEQRLAKLRSDNDREGPIFKMRHDPRVTPVGRFLRKYSVDEMPQFLNVLLGDMSLVGPRPPLPSEVTQYGERESQRLSVRPGLTCYWQISGRSDLTFEEWMALDLKYLEEMSLWTDLTILAKTPLAVLQGKGAY